jgi:hypothetical protein
MLFWLCKETIGYLQKLERLVQQGRGVDEASNFARWLQFSGLLKILEAYPQPKPLEVDGVAVRRLMERVIATAGELHKGGKLPYNPSESTVDEINAKVDFMLSQLAKNISPPFQTHTPAPGSPGLPVIAGGASSPVAAG